MSEREAPPLDAEFEKLKKRRLDVLNTSARETDAFVLTGEGTAPSSGGGPPSALRDRVIQALRTVYDPEIPLNIYELGLIYDLDVTDAGDVNVRMTLTAPACPVAGALVGEVHDRVLSTPGVRHARTELVWDPPWTRERLSLEARLALGLL